MAKKKRRKNGRPVFAALRLTDEDRIMLAILEKEWGTKGHTDTIREALIRGVEAAGHKVERGAAGKGVTL